MHPSTVMLTVTGWELLLLLRTTIPLLRRSVIGDVTMPTLPANRPLFIRTYWPSEKGGLFIALGCCKPLRQINVVRSGSYIEFATLLAPCRVCANER